MGFSFKMQLPKHRAKNSQITHEIEIAGAFDAFVSLEEIAPDLDWAEVLAASWGMPCPSSIKPEETAPLFTRPSSPPVLNPQGS